jgi:Leucine-rich repeat (LRR) protein
MGGKQSTSKKNASTKDESKVQLAKAGLKQIPTQYLKSSSVVELWVQENEISHLPPEIANWTSLELFYANNNQISSLPPEIKSWTSLEELNLRYNLN